MNDLIFAKNSLTETGRENSCHGPQHSQPHIPATLRGGELKPLALAKPLALLGEAHMPYTAEISRTNPACLILLLDQSGSMAEVFGEGSVTKADFVADVVNRALHDVVIRCTQPEEVRDYYYISVVGYGSSVGPSFSGALSGKTHVPLSDVADNPSRLEVRTKKVLDGAGGIIEQTVRFPIWMDAVACGGTPMCDALMFTRKLLDEWLSEHKHGFPPTVLHITDAGSTDGDPSSIASQIRSRSTSDGEALLFNCHVTGRHSIKIEYPASESQLPDELACTLFNISSPLPAPFRRAGRSIGLDIQEGARGFVFNGDPVSVAQFFDIGTRPANLR